MIAQYSMTLSMTSLPDIARAVLKCRPSEQWIGTVTTLVQDSYLTMLIYRLGNLLKITNWEILFLTNLMIGPAL